MVPSKRRKCEAVPMNRISTRRQRLWVSPLFFLSWARAVLQRLVQPRDLCAQRASLCALPDHMLHFGYFSQWIHRRSRPWCLPAPFRVHKGKRPVTTSLHIWCQVVNVLSLPDFCSSLVYFLLTWELNWMTVTALGTLEREPTSFDLVMSL